MQTHRIWCLPISLAVNAKLLFLDLLYLFLYSCFRRVVHVEALILAERFAFSCGILTECSEGRACLWSHQWLREWSPGKLDLVSSNRAMRWEYDILVVLMHVWVQSSAVFIDSLFGYWLKTCRNLISIHLCKSWIFFHPMRDVRTFFKSVQKLILRRMVTWEQS